jgi:hypothetical protein
MNIQTESSSRPIKPLLGIDPLKAVAPERPKPVRPAKPSEEDAYGCVEWFNYEKHPLSAAARAKAKT